MRELKMRVYTSGGMIGPFDLSQHPMYWAHKLRDGERLLYTGLKDRNDVEIYEGDILKTDSTDYFNLSFTAIVKFGEYLQDGSGGEYNGEACLGFYYEAVNPNEVDEYGSRLVPEYMVTCSPLGFNNSEVIGNIHQHPHLLEVSTE